MKANDLLKVITLSAIAAFIVYLLFEKAKDENEKKELKDALNSQNLISENIRQRLWALLEQHPDIDEDIKGELSQIASLLGLQQESTAILKIAKIIENLLRKLFKNDTAFKEWVVTNNKKKLVFADYLDFAHVTKVIPKEDYHIISILKLFRNKEAHELNVGRDKGKLVAACITGLTVTFELYNLVARKTQLLIQEKSMSELAVEV
ncbi:MAG: hypothetical protein JNL72_15510 [Flavipsychrobacter sp.]|nr:hypothetical protein [Flavipsychrobacter sp.]